MKRVILSMCAVGLLAMAKLAAQDAVRVTVPFGFYVGESDLLPAGTYNVGPCSPGVIMVRNCHEGIAVMQLTSPTGESNDPQAKLIFNKYGDNYFLNEIRGLPISSSVAVPMTSHEKSVRSEMATVTTFETVTVPKPEDQENQPEQPPKPPQ